MKRKGPERWKCAKNLQGFTDVNGKPLTTQQHVKTIRKPQRAPAVPTTHVNRINRITPKMFWMQGK